MAQILENYSKKKNILILSVQIYENLIVFKKQNKLAIANEWALTFKPNKFLPTCSTTFSIQWIQYSTVFSGYQSGLLERPLGQTKVN